MNFWIKKWFLKRSYLPLSISNVDVYFLHLWRVVGTFQQPTHATLSSGGWERKSVFRSDEKLKGRLSTWWREEKNLFESDTCILCIVCHFKSIVETFGMINWKSIIKISDDRQVKNNFESDNWNFHLVCDGNLSRICA